MTKQEAIKRIQDHMRVHGIGKYPHNFIYEALSMAISALREQEKRERGCEYCNDDRDGYRKMIGAFSITNPFHGNVWNIETCHCKPRQIYFCPMCGRMLSELPKEE